MKQKELARLFFRDITKIEDNETLDQAAKIEALYHSLNRLFVELTRAERIQFTTLFARIAYACQKHLIDRKQQFYIHTFRKQARNYIRQTSITKNDDLYIFGIKTLAEAISAAFHQAIPMAIERLIPQAFKYNFSPIEMVTYKAKARVVILEDDAEKEQFIAQDEDRPDESIRVQYNIADRNENFKPTIQAIQRVFRFPITLNLLEVEIDKDGIYYPRAFVIEPDYLIDVTAIAECFKDFGVEPIFYLLKKYLPFVRSKHLMIGNIANFFLDELMTNPETTYKQSFPKVFRLNPLGFTLLEDKEIKEIQSTCQKHYVNLKQMVVSGFKAVDIEPKDCFLEPTFYSEQYGIQGRLDVLYQGEKSAIVELKSGKTFRPNQYKINHNHYTQTLLYDLLIKSTFGKQTDASNYILYSGMDQQQLRYAPTIKAQQFEAIQTRNQLVTIERVLSKMTTDNLSLMRRLRVDRMPYAKGFLARDLALFEKVFWGMSELERAYFITFSAFIAREHQLTKTGVAGLENVNGLAALWLHDLPQKENRFSIISHLEIEENNAKQEEPIICFRKTENTHPLANFRKGDIAVLYPYDATNKGVLHNQIFKCTIINIDKEKVEIRLRSRQFNNTIFNQNEYWNLEHDLMDNSFTEMYRALFAFAQSPMPKKQLLLTTAAPQETPLLDITCPEDLTEEQKIIFKKAVSAEDYFLLWGPPGTGKTSKMLRSITNYLFNDTKENILLLAYTNRAVDEICEAIESIDVENIRDHYVRIGSRYSTSERFRGQLLDSKMSGVKRRSQLREIIQSHRIFVATVASFANKLDLLQFKTFDRVIIDEASQILEPMLVGLLPRFKRFILVGDHKQLPAVVIQDQEASSVSETALHEIGLKNLRNSLFERLYHRCRANNWDWAYANLSHQGRMHEQIMAFPNRHFYENKLQILPPNISTHQVGALAYELPENATALEQQLCAHRLLFFPTEIDYVGRYQKVNAAEAALVAILVENFQKIWASNHKDWTANSLGIITPYRAQIAKIRAALQHKNINPDSITIDTVERYQGGARDIILISLCTNSAYQLDSMISLSEDGVDRKLNVALTRAREHLVLIGNAEILEGNLIYRKLLDVACTFSPVWN